MTTANTMTILELIKKQFQLQSLEYDMFNPQVLSEPHEVDYIAGYRLFFGGPIYAKKTFYNHLFHWKTEDGRKFSIMLEPHIEQEGSMTPKEIDLSTRDKLVDSIKQTLNKNFVADI